MALPILDGNQSATTLSSILTGGEHIPAHTVVSLGTQAITNIATAVSGSVVSISNFPATQPVSIASVTIGSLPLIAGTVTANVPQTIVTKGIGQDAVSITGIPVIAKFITNSGNIGIETGLPLQFVAGTDDIFVKNVLFKTNIDGENALIVGDGNPLPISGTVTVGNTVTIAGSVTLGAGTAQIGSVTASISNFPATQAISIASVTIGNSVTIASLPAISGTVTANTFAIQGTAVTTSDFTSTTASTLLAGFNAGREVLTIFNEGAGNLHICAGATCTTIAYQVRLSSGDYFEVPNHQTTITHSAVFATAGTARVTEVS